jgi:histone H3/H4
VASREIRKFQKTTDLLIRKAPFQHLVREIVQNMSRKSDLQMQSTALLALQEAAEYFMVDVFNNTKLCTLHGTCVTIKVKDLFLACRIQGIGMVRASGMLTIRSNIQWWQNDDNQYRGGRGEGNGNNDHVGKSNGHGDSDRDEERERATVKGYGTLTAMATATATKTAK